VLPLRTPGEVAARHPATPHRLVDRDADSGQLAGVALTGVDDAVVDDHRRSFAVVPEQPVEGP
jgi:hypothetical protein